MQVQVIDRVTDMPRAGKVSAQQKGITSREAAEKWGDDRQNGHENARVYWLKSRQQAYLFIPLTLPNESGDCCMYATQHEPCWGDVEVVGEEDDCWVYACRGHRKCIDGGTYEVRHE